MRSRRAVRFDVTRDMVGPRESVAFYVPGDPAPKLRARVGAYGGKTPAKTVAYERLVGLMARQAMGPARLPMAGALEVLIFCWFLVPPSLSKAAREERLAGGAWHTVKPDEDNVGKAIKDAMQKIVFHDDSQIARSVVEKRYQPAGGPYAKVVINPI